MRRGEVLKTLSLFQGYGIELEYMVVDAESLDVRPISDHVLIGDGGRVTNEIERGGVAWSNELVMHVLEMKTNGPTESLKGITANFQRSVAEMNAMLVKSGAMLMPTGMHPWMNPASETRLWHHDNKAIYETFNAIFDCRGHGWANLQSLHLNLPFSGDEDFARLHAAIRVLMPIMPALAASSPYADGKTTGFLDTRLVHYKNNSSKIPSISGKVIPEQIFSMGEYSEKILEKIYSDIEPYDTNGILRYEWLNARGAIPRFDRDTIEIRVLDSQESPVAELAIVSTVVGVIRSLVEERVSSYEAQSQWGVEPLAEILDIAIRKGEKGEVLDRNYMKTLGIDDVGGLTAGEIWKHLLTRGDVAETIPAECTKAVDIIIERGSLASRIVEAVESKRGKDRLKEVYKYLSECLSEGRSFLPEDC